MAMLRAAGYTKACLWTRPQAGFCIAFFSIPELDFASIAFHGYR